MKRGAERKEFPLSPYGVRAVVVGGARSPHPNPLFFLLGLLGIAFLFSYNKPCANFNEATLQTPKQTISLALANTPEKQSKGLGGCKYIPKNSGMLFGPFDRTRSSTSSEFRSAQGQNATFWMKNMLIPIDIIWIRDNRVVGIEKNVPSFPLDTPDEQLPKYTSPVLVDAVLEVGVGKAEEYGIDENSVVRDTSPIL